MPAAVDDATAVTVLTAIANPSLEAQLVAGFTRDDLGITVVRRCVDLVELLAAGAARTARAALVSADLRGLDRESVAALAGYGVVTVGLASDESGERLLHQLGAEFVLADGSPSEQVAGALRAAAVAVSAAPDPTGRSGRARVIPGAGRREASVPFSGQTRSAGGKIIAVWGPTGAPGRTTVALGLADTLATRETSTLLIDADPYGGCVATLTGMLDEAPGVAAACRAANAGSLDVARLADCCRELSPGLRVLSGIGHPARWPELRPAALDVVLSLGRLLVPVTVVDCGFSLEDDEELSYDTLAPRRNAATLTSLRAADRVVAVGSADPVGLSRLIRELPRLAETLGEPLGDLTSSGRCVVVVNRLRSGVCDGDPRRSAAHALARHAGVRLAGGLPQDVLAADAAHGLGRLLSEAAPHSALWRAMGELTNSVHPQQPAQGAKSDWRRWSRRRRQGATLVS